MTTNELPPVPQIGVNPLALPPDQEQRLLNRRRKADQSDPFASDPDEEVRRLGRLALRRDVMHPYDYLALGDLCARLSLAEHDRRLRVFYVGKVLYAYRQAMELAGSDPDDRELAERAYESFVRWVVRVARAVPSRRNIAVALWAVAEVEQNGALDRLSDEAQLLALWYVAPPQAEDMTPAPDRTPSPEPEDVTEIYPDEIVTHGDEGTDVGTGFLSIEAPAELSETRSDQSDVFVLEIEATQGAPQGHTATPLPLLNGFVRRTEDGEFAYGDRIDGRYEVAQVLRGGMGIVYLCYDHEDRKSVAIKTFQSRFLTNENAVARFTNEALTWIRLEKHRHIVRAQRVQKFEGRPHIILEHISGPEGLGPDLRSWIRHNRIDLPTALEFGLHIVLGMQHASTMLPGLVHRDLKPANILVRHDGIAKVTDFGLVRSLDLDDLPGADEINSDTAHLTRAGAVIGT
ncbi:MAG: serine/threonine protein kinase, partial [Chloroflexi bacterium]|nr:serine/threonine protein kinase [Chloroflexota bacterium]